MTPRQDAEIQPTRALAHPAWMASLLVLLVNDHLLKGAALLPGWLTGKLSDVAGLFMAPALLAAAMRVRTRRGFGQAHVVLGVAFAALKLWAPAARLFEATLGWAGVPSRVVVDPTDLLALPALAAAYVLLAPLTERGRDLAPAARSSALLLASFGCVATSAPPPEREPFSTDPRSPSSTFPMSTGALGLANDSGVPQVIRLRRPRASIQLNCQQVATSPPSFLSADLFAPAETWLVEDGRVLPLAAQQGGGWTQDCQVMLIDGDHLAPSVVFWTTSQFPTTSIATALGSATVSRTISLRGTAEKITMSEHPAAFGSLATQAVEVPAECLLPPPEQSVEWSTPLPAGELPLLSVEASPNGCHALEFAKRKVYLCGVQGEFPFAAGDVLTHSETQSGQVARIERKADGLTLVMGRGSADLIRQLWPQAEVPAVIATGVNGCPGQPIECGGQARPAELQIGETKVRAGGSVPVGDGRLDVLQARLVPVFDSACSEASLDGGYAEWTALVP